MPLQKLPSIKTIFSLKSTIRFILVTGIICALYGWLFERHWVEVTYHEVKAPFQLTAIHLSDLHLNDFGNREEKVLSIINDIKPDMIFVTGDSISKHTDPIAFEKVFSNLKAPKGVFYVSGNWEHRDYPNLEGRLQKFGVINLTNSNYKSENFWLVGLDDLIEGTPDEDKAFQDVPDEAFTIALFHSPEHFDQLFSEVNFAFSGHTHGGQVRLPFIRPLSLPDGSGDYVSGWYQKQKSYMYVSRGIGTSVLPIRFLCRPEVAVFQFKN